jgi:multidrug efflux pump subunit AcrB
MKLAELAVKNPQFTLVVFALLAALGVNSFMTIPRSEDPQFPIPGFVVVAVYPGAAPIDVEELVANPIEESLDSLDDIKKMLARISESVAVIQIEFDSHVDVDKKEQEVRRQIAAVRQDLPGDLYSLEVTRFSTTNVSLVQVALVSDGAPWAALEEHAENLERRLQALKGIKDAEIHGVPRREVQITLDIEKLALQGIALDRVLQAIGSDNQTIPGGNVQLAGRRMGIKTSGAFRTLADVESTVIAGDGQSIVRLGDVATVAWATAPHEVRTRFDGQRALFVTALQKDAQNVFAVAESIHTALDAFEATLPSGITLERGFDQSENVAMRLDRLYEDFAFAILLVLVTLLPLGFRAAAVVMVAIPLSLAIGLTLLHLLGYNLNQLSIVGFVIALGLLVDDAIVVVENISRFLREGKSRREAAILATKQIAIAVVGCTATLIFAFVPMLFLPGNAGDFIRSLPMAVVLTIIGSLVVALTIIPFLASIALPRTSDEHGNVFLRTLNAGIEHSFRPVLAFALKNKTVSLIAALAIVGGSLMLVPTIGFSLFPKAGTNQFLVSVEAQDGASITNTEAAVEKVDAVLRSKDEIAWTMSNVGKGNPQAYYNVPPHPESASYGEIFAELESYDPKTSPAFFEALRLELSDLAGAKVVIKEFENGPPIDAPIAIRLLGDDLDKLTEAATMVERILDSTSGTIYVDNPYKLQRTDLVAKVDRDKAGMLGVPTIAIAQMVRLAVAGLSAGSLRTDDGKEYDLSVVLADGREGLKNLDRLEVPTVVGQTARFADVAALEMSTSPNSIQHFGAKQRSVTVSASVAAGQNVDRTTQDVLAQLAATQLPAGVRWMAAGEVESRKESFGGLGAAILVATFMILAILVLEFKTFRGTLVVASVIPLGIAGGLAALYLTGNTLSFTAVVGFIALIGIEIKTSILLVDFTNQLRAEGMALLPAVKKAGEVRFLPILLTTLTAIGGLMPLALQGSALYSPLAWVIIGGLVSSTLLARVVTPVLYVMLAPRDPRPDAEAEPHPNRTPLEPLPS